MLLVDIHQLNIILAQPVRLRALEHQVDNIRGVIRLEGENVVVLSSPQDLGQGDQVDTEGDVAVAAVGGETLGLEQHGHEGDVGVIHGLEGNAGVIAVEVTVLHEIFDGVDDLKEGARVSDSFDELRGRLWVTYTLKQTGMF